MSWKATAYVKSLKLAPNGEPVKRSEKLFLFVLADSHNEDKKGAWPSMAKLARAALLSVRRMREIARQCRIKGMICWEKRTDESGGTESNLFHFCALDCAHEPLQGEGQSNDPQRSGSAEISPGGVKKEQGGGGEISARGECDSSHGGGANSPQGGVLNDAPPPYTQPPVEPPGEPPHTHTRTGARARERHPVAQAQASLPGVGVGSRYSQEVCEQWAEARKRQPGSKIVDAGAVGFARYCDGKADEGIAKWLEDQSPERIAEARTSEEDKSLTYSYAAHLVHSMIERGTAAIPAIDSLSVNADVRARLIEKFVAEE